MKRIIGLILVIAFVFPQFAYAQKKKDRNRRKIEKKALEYYETVFGKRNKMFTLSEIPDEYKDESKVVLAQQVHLALLRNTTMNTNSTKVALRKRVYLNDEAAVNEFSEFFYQNSDVVGVTIIKPDGTKETVDLDEAVEVTSDVPKFYQDRFHSDDYYKIAIAGLEVGDIVDYYKVFNESYLRNIELLIPVASEAPIVEQEIIFDIDKLWTAYYNSFNGAAQMKLDPKGGFDMKGRQRKSVKRLRFTAKNTAAVNDERWSFDRLDAPLIKFMALPPGVNYGGDDKVSNNLDKKKMFDNALSFASLYVKTEKRDIGKRVKALNLVNEDIDYAAEIIYRMLRVNTLRKVDGDSETAEDFSYYLSRNSRELPGEIFAVLYAELLKSAEISSDIVMVMPKSGGDLSDVVLYSEPTFGVYIPSTKKYYWPVNSFSVPGKTPSYLQGANGFKVDYAKISKRKKNYAPCTVGMSTIDDNIYEVKMKAIVGDDNTLQVDVNMLLTGYYRNVYSSLFLYNTNHLKEEIKMTRANLSVREIKNEIKQAKKRKKKKKFDELEFNFNNSDWMEYNKNKKELFENWLESEYEVTEIGDKSVVENGMSGESNLLHIQFDFTSDSYVNKAGPNLVFDLGKLIGDQVELTEDEINERESDINFHVARSIVNTISVEIPEGKTARGLDQLNMNVVNEIGEFVSTVKQVDNIIQIKTIKKYKNNSFSADQWSKMVEFLEAAFQFTEKKVILK